MADKNTLISALRVKAQITDQEQIYANVGDLLDDAYMEHAPDLNKDYSLLAAREEELVLLLAWERVCLARASLAAPQPSLRGAGEGFGADRDSPFYKNVRLAKTLRERYFSIKATLALSSETAAGAAGDITVGDLIVQDALIDARVPYSVAPKTSAPQLIAAAPVSGTVVLSWTKISDPNFIELYLLKASTSGIFQIWNQDGTNGIPFAATGSDKIYNTTDFIKKGVKVTSLTTGTYYFVLVLKDSANNYVYSNEVTVVIP